jgi:hypothetical protein
VAKRFLPILILLLVAGCQDERPNSRALGSGCKHTGLDVYLCLTGESSNDHGRFVVLEDGGPRALHVNPPGKIGHWAWAETSPDGKTILGQWSAECEVPVAYLIPAGGGPAREAAGPSYSSRALGWAPDGRAIVDVLARDPCGSVGPRAGVYLVDPGGAKPALTGARSLGRAPFEYRGRFASAALSLPLDSAEAAVCPVDASLASGARVAGVWLSREGLSVAYAVRGARQLYACDAVRVGDRWSVCARTITRSRDPSRVALAGGATGMCNHGRWRAFTWIAVARGASWVLVDHRSSWTIYDVRNLDPALLRVSAAHGIDPRGKVHLRAVVLDRRFHPLADQRFTAFVAG